MSVAGLIPMKGHSERVPRKNLRPIAGKPLFHWITICLLRRDRDRRGDRRHRQR